MVVLLDTLGYCTQIRPQAIFNAPYIPEENRSRFHIFRACRRGRFIQEHLGFGCIQVDLADVYACP
jgi:hypothetical protein